ncbi:MAG TPA: hypothetical protein DHW02_01565 [Ktedonobacter sp.]|nr:hypothetical protein [Ktedonobacter sp.]
MSTFAWTQLEARVSALERRQSNTDMHVEEVNKDATTNFKQLSYDMTASFDQLSKYLGKIEDNNEMRFQSIETTLGEHSRILGEHSKVLDDHTKRLSNIETLLTQILARLPENR